MPKIADIVVIGGGVHGASVAFHLAQAGAGKVVLVEKQGICSGPTAKSGALIRPLFGEGPYNELVLAATSMFENWNDLVGGDAGFVQKGFLRITNSLDENILGGRLDLMRQLGVPFDIIPNDRLRDCVNNANFCADEVGLLLTKGGYADPLLTTTSLALAAQRLGVELIEGALVTDIETLGDRIECVHTSQGTIHTPIIVNCAGPWAPGLAKMVGIDLPIKTHRVPTCLFRRPLAMNSQGPVLSDGVNRVSLRDVGETIVRAALFVWIVDTVDPDEYDESIDRDQLQAIREPLKRRVNCMNLATFAGGFSAIYDVTPDSHPIVSEMSQVKGFWCDCGWSGNGFASAPVLGQCLADQIMGKTSTIDLSAFQWPRAENAKPRVESTWVFR